MFQMEERGPTLLGIGSYSLRPSCTSPPFAIARLDGMYVDIRQYVDDIRDVLRKEGIVSLMLYFLRIT